MRRVRGQEKAPHGRNRPYRWSPMPLAWAPPVFLICAQERFGRWCRIYGDVSGDNYRKRRQRLLGGDLNPHRTLIASTTVTDIIEMVKGRHDGFTVKLEEGRYHLDLCEAVTKTEENRKGGGPQSRRKPGKNGP